MVTEKVEERDPEDLYLDLPNTPLDPRWRKERSIQTTTVLHEANRNPAIKIEIRPPRSDDVVRRPRVQPKNIPLLGVIIDFLVQHYGVPQEEIVSKRQDRHIVFPRHIGLWLACTYTNMSNLQISIGFGQHTKTSAVYAKKQIAQKRAKNSSFLKETEDLKVLFEKFLKERSIP